MQGGIYQKLPDGTLKRVDPPPSAPPTPIPVAVPMPAPAAVPSPATPPTPNPTGVI